MNAPSRVLVIGGTACGPKTAARVKRLNPQAQVTILEQSETISFGACGMPYYVEGLFEDINTLIETPVGVRRTKQFFKDCKGVDVHTGTEATQIDRDNKRVFARRKDTGEEEEHPYDKLVLATGARALRPPIPGVDLGRVWTMKASQDAETLSQSISTQGLRKAVILGAGLIGVEMAEALTKRGLEVTLVEMFDQILPGMLDKEMAMLGAKHLRQQGVDLKLGSKITGFQGETNVEAVQLEGETIPADMVLLSAGVKHNDELAREAGLECYEKGGIKINHFCQTSDPDIYAGGDCVLNGYLHPILRSPLYVPLGSTANKHGRVIANNIAGHASTYPGVQCTSICKVFDYTFSRTGLTEKMALQEGYSVETMIVSGGDKPHYIPGHAPLVVKLVASQRDRTILGAQIVGPGVADKRIDVAASAIAFNATLDDLANIDLSYAPPFSPPLDPITVAAFGLNNKMDGLANGLPPLKAKEIMDNEPDLVLLDVRGPEEYRQMRLPDPRPEGCEQRIVHIPLGQLRSRIDEIPRDKKVLAFCKISMRGYEAQRILEAEGFKDVCFIEGGLVGWPLEVETGEPQR
ncbi:MAG: FAD-dependent oxidoreductase [Desulfohalobiaceae bacterium]